MALDVKTKALIEWRRRQFLEQIRGSAAIFPSAPVAIRNGDVAHEYRQDTDFYYLTGFEEPNSVAVFISDGQVRKFVMFVQPKDPENEIWSGPRAGPEGAMRDYGADAAYTIDELDKELPGLLEAADKIYYRFGSDANFDQRIVRLMRHFQRHRQREGRGPTAVVDPAEILHQMRLVKRAEDLELLGRAIDITCEGHLAAMRALKPGMYEYEVEALLRYVFRKNGSPRCGYPPIVASGPNALVLHYTINDRIIHEGELLLIDAGAEFGYYTGDVTRTIPASGHFTREQIELYELVLEAQLEAIGAVRPGAKFIEPHERAVRALTAGMVRLGLLKGDVDQLIQEGKYKQFYMHRTSHWLGMDVHDAGPYKVADEWRTLEPGMVLTIEPGLYIPQNADVEPRYRGIGIRIEDDLLVTEDGHRVLSQSAPKDPAEIEALMREARS
jgi:Xaa-Pro aminopeptidase